MQIYTFSLFELHLAKFYQEKEQFLNLLDVVVNYHLNRYNQ